MIEPGRNIAIKVPLFKWEETVTFYRDKIGLKVVHELEGGVAFAFGSMKLWVDRVDRQSQVDIWLEVFTDDPVDAMARLGGPRRDELEPLDGVNGHWTSDPCRYGASRAKG